MSSPWSARPLAKTSNIKCCAVAVVTVLTACSTPPLPPSVDESTRRPVNVRTAVELKSCQAEMSRVTTLLATLARAQSLTLSTGDTCTSAAAQSQHLPLVLPPQPETGAMTIPAPAAVAGNMVLVVPFGLGSAAWRVEASDAAALVRRANDSALIMIRGRTDAKSDSLQETTLARRRAEAAADFLQQAGVSRDKLRLTWQGAGDPIAGLHVADRALSRRVEVEFYMAAPTLVGLRSGPAAGAGFTRSASLQ